MSLALDFWPALFFSFCLAEGCSLPPDYLLGFIFFLLCFCVTTEEGHCESIVGFLARGEAERDCSFNMLSYYNEGFVIVSLLQRDFSRYS